MELTIIPNYINGKRVAGGNEHRLPVFNPASGNVVRYVTDSEGEDAQSAIDSARQAWPGWAHFSPLKRARILMRFRELLQRDSDQLARCISEEHGKILSDAHGELARGIEVVEFACGIPHLLKGEFSAGVGGGVDCHSLMQPLGVCVGITPFNFPAMVPLWMFPVALASGNTFVLKPSEKVPSLALKMAELLSEAGLPDGVFNVVNGGKNVVDVLLKSQDVQAVSFVGSTPVAEHIYRTASEHGKRCQALGGAKNHAILMPDADMEQAVSAIASAAFGAAGERCMALSVVVAVGDETADELCEKLLIQMDSITVGPGDKQGTEYDMGPVISAQHRDRISHFIETGVVQGASLLRDGRGLQIIDHESGFFIGPTLFDKVSPQMDIYRNEIFGPVLCVVRAQSFEEALVLINQNEFGNGAVLFTRSGGAAREFTCRVTAGMVGINIPVPVPVAFHCFGGWKRSIFGPLNMHGPDGVRFYTRMKTVTSRWSNGESGPASFAMPVLK